MIPSVDVEKCSVRRKVITDFIFYIFTRLYRNDLLRRASRESDQNKQRFVVVIGGAGFSFGNCWESIGRKVRCINMARKDESGFLIHT